MCDSELEPDAQEFSVYHLKHVNFKGSFYFMAANKTLPYFNLGPFNPDSVAATPNITPTLGPSNVTPNNLHLRPCGHAATIEVVKNFICGHAAMK